MPFLKRPFLRFIPALTALICAAGLLPVVHAKDQPAQPPQPAEGQEGKKELWEPGVRLASSVIGVMQFGLSMQEKGFGFNDRLCILGASVQKGKTVSFAKRLEAGKTYLFIAGGDKNAENVNVGVYQNNKAEITDDEAKPVAGVIFECKKTATYSIRVELADAKATSFCALQMMVKDGGTKLTADEISTAISLSVQGWTALNEQMKGKAAFNEGSNQWTFYGGVLAEGRALEITNVKPGGGLCVIVATGSEQVQDISLSLKTPDGKTGAEDKVDPIALLVIETQPKDNLRLNIKNAKAKGPALIFTTILHPAE